MKTQNLTKTEFDQITAGSKPVLVDFWAPWCSYCRRIGPAYDSLAQEQEDVVFAKVDIDQEPELARLQGIRVIPTLVLYRDGKALGSVVAPESKAAISQFLRETLEK